jgi:hypothetical protein
MRISLISVFRNLLRTAFPKEPVPPVIKRIEFEKFINKLV